GFWRLTVVNYGPCFLSGVLAYALLRKPLTRSTLPGWTWYLVIVGVVGLTAGLHPGDESMPRNWLVCLPVGLAIPFIRELDASRLTRMAKVVCEYSYGIYLTHVAALWLAFVYFRELARAEQFAIFAATAALFAYASYHLIERPFVSTGKRIASLVTRQHVGGLSAAIVTSGSTTVSSTSDDCPSTCRVFRLRRRRRVPAAQWDAGVDPWSVARPLGRASLPA